MAVPRGGDAHDDALLLRREGGRPGRVPGMMMSAPPIRPLIVLQHCESEYLGLMEDHFEGRRIRFTYVRPFAAGHVPDGIGQSSGLVLLGGGSWGSAGAHDLPGLHAETLLAARYLRAGLPVIGLGLGAQILCRAAGGASAPAPFLFELAEARRTADGALGGFLPACFPMAVCMRDRPVLPDSAEVLAIDQRGRPAVFQIGASAFGFTGHPGAKAGMFEDLVMEFDDAPDDAAATLRALRAAQDAVADALVRIMTGLVKTTGLMAASDVFAGRPPGSGATG